MKIDKSLNLTNKELTELPIELQKEIFDKLETNSYICYVESNKEAKIGIEIDKYPCVINGVIIIC